MKLHYSPASPYVRKVMVCAIARGIAGLLEKVSTNPHQSPADLLADNPLSKVPAHGGIQNAIGGGLADHGLQARCAAGRRE